MWESVAKDLFQPGIQAKFMQNLELLQVLVEKTGYKTIVECANNRLWGTGVPLAREGCLSKEKLISPGILGELLMETHENQTVFPMAEQVKPHASILSGIPTLPGITDSSLLGVTHNVSNAVADPTLLSVHTPSLTMATLPPNYNKKTQIMVV